MRRPAEPRGIGDLLRELIATVGTLFRQEVELAKAELSEKASQAGSAVVLMAIGGLLAFAGLIVLLQALVIWLSEGPPDLDPALAALIVGGVVIVIGGGLALYAKRLLNPANLAPNRTTASLKQDVELVRERLGGDEPREVT